MSYPEPFSTSDQVKTCSCDTCQYKNQNNNQGFNISSLLPLLSLMGGGKPQLNNVLSQAMQNSPQMKELEPLLGMFSALSKNKENKTEIKDDLPDIDDLKRIE